MLTLLEADAVLPTWVFGVAAFLILMLALAVVRAVGASQPHS